MLKEAGYQPASDREPWDLWLWQSRSADMRSRTQALMSGGGLERRLATLQPPDPLAVVGAIPGGLALSNKRSLWIRLVKAYGRARAETIAPATWLPDFPADRRLLEARRGSDALYLLKDSSKNRRKGLTVTRDPLIGGSSRHVVQAMVPDQLLISGHRCSLRCWVVLVRHQGVLSAHLYREGIVMYVPGGSAVEDQWITRQQKHIGPAGAPQRLSTLCSTLAVERADPGTLHAGIVRAVRGAVNASLGDLRGSVLSSHRCFELLGADFVVDRHLKPWLLELNRMPSLESRQESERPLRSAMLRSAFACGGVAGFSPDDECPEVGRWAIQL